MAPCLDIILWMNQVIWGWKSLPLQDLLFFWLQHEQHVARYLGQFYFAHIKRISFSDNSMNALWLSCRVEMVKKWAFQIVSSVVNSSVSMFWFRNFEYGAKEIQVLLLVRISSLSIEKSSFSILQAESLTQLWMSSGSLFPQLWNGNLD